MIQICLSFNELPNEKKIEFLLQQNKMLQQSNDLLTAADVLTHNNGILKKESNSDDFDSFLIVYSLTNSKPARIKNRSEDSVALQLFKSCRNWINFSASFSSSFC